MAFLDFGMQSATSIRFVASGDQNLITVTVRIQKTAAHALDFGESGATNLMNVVICDPQATDAFDFTLGRRVFKTL